MKISVVTPSFNQGHFLEETIRSVLNQNYPDLEYIIIDGGSTDESVSIIKKYEHRLAYWISEPDNGQSHAINKGLEKVTGDIVTWLGSDDLYMPGTFELVNREFESLPDSIGLVHGYAEMFRDGKTLAMDQGFRLQNLERRLAGMAFPQPSSFFRRSVLMEAGFLNAEYHYGMDYDLFARMSVLCDFHKINACLSRYRIHSASKSGGGLETFRNDWIRVFNSLVSGLSYDDLKNDLSELKLEREIVEDTEEFFKRHRDQVILDKKLLMFFFICNVFRLTYLSGKFNEARVFAVYLDKHFEKYFKLVPDVYHIISRSLKYPSWALTFGRKVRTSLFS